MYPNSVTCAFIGDRKGGDTATQGAGPMGTEAEPGVVPTRNARAEEHRGLGEARGGFSLSAQQEPLC